MSTTRAGFLAGAAGIAVSATTASAATAGGTPLGPQPPVPVVAPWQTGYTRYPTQIISYTDTGNPAGTGLEITIPTGQWWRVVWVSAEASTSSTAATRGVEFYVADAGANRVLRVQGNGTITASKSVFADAFPGATAYAVTTVGTAEYFVFGIPDMLWPQGYTFAWAWLNQQTGDAYSLTASYLAIEMYTEQYNTQGQTVLVPTPLLT